VDGKPLYWWMQKCPQFAIVKEKYFFCFRLSLSNFLLASYGTLAEGGVKP
jgi:hypothetical protein